MARSNRRTLPLSGERLWLVWYPDDRALAVSTTQAGGALNISRVPIDGSGSTEPLTTSRQSQYPASWSREHDVLAVLQHDGAKYQLWMFPMRGDSEPMLFLDVPYSVSHVDFSPDGRWITYQSGDAVYVQGYPVPGEQIPISVDGGTNPAWGRNGSELYYMRRAPGDQQIWQIMVVDIDTRDGFRPGQPRVLFDSPGGSTTPLRSYDVGPDGRFIMTRPAGDPEPPFTQLEVVLNWTEELRRRVPARR